MTTAQLQIGDERRAKDLGRAASALAKARRLIAAHAEGDSTLRYLSWSLADDQKSITRVMAPGCRR